MRFRFIAAEKAHHSLTVLCRCLRVTRSGFYAWRKRPESARAQRDRRLKGLVHASFAASQQRYGSPRVHRDLLAQQERVRRKRVIRLMQEDGLQARRRKRFKCTTMSDHDQPVAANVLDRGIGLDEQAGANLFEPFYRGERARSTAGGVGIGLAVCRRIVHLLGGRIWARARDEGGAEFGFALPIAPDVDDMPLRPL